MIVQFSFNSFNFYLFPELKWILFLIHATKKNDLWNEVGCWNMKHLMIWMLPNERIWTFIARSIYEIIIIMNDTSVTRSWSWMKCLRKHMCWLRGANLMDLILNEQRGGQGEETRRSQFDGNSKWTNHTWAWRMKLYCFVIKKSHSVWSKSFIWEWSIFEKPVENEIQWKTHWFFSDAHWG